MRERLEIVRDYWRPAHRQQRLRRIMLSILALILAGMFAYDAWAALLHSDGAWDRIRTSGVLRFGMDASYPPFSKAITWPPVGLDIDVANEIGRRLGVKVEFANMGFDGLYEALHRGEADALISALSVDPTRVGSYLYSQNYLDAGLVIVSTDGRYRQMTDLDGHLVAVEYGSQGDEYLRVWQRRLHILNAARFTTPDDALDATQIGQTDAAIVDWVTARLYLRQHPGLMMAQVTHNPYCIVVRLSSFDLGGAISQAIRDMQADGTLDQIIAKWL